MTRREYEAIAGALKATQPTTGRQEWIVWDATRESLANRLSELNPNFNITQFNDACGVESFPEDDEEEDDRTDRAYREADENDCEIKHNAQPKGFYVVECGDRDDAPTLYPTPAEAWQAYKRYFL